MRGGQRIFPTALAALQGLHETIVLVHKLLILVCFKGIKNPFSREEKRENHARSSHLFPNHLGSSWNWHLVTGGRAPAGCRGFIGPVPQPLDMRFIVSTNTDR